MRLALPAVFFAAAGALAAACAHSQQKLEAGAIEVVDAIHGVTYELPPGGEPWQVSHEGNAHSASGVEAEVSSFPMARPSSPAACRDLAHKRWGSPDKGDAPSEQTLGDAPTATLSFTAPAADGSAQRNRFAFFPRGADCLLLHVAGAKGDRFAESAFDTAARSFKVLALPPDRQREVDLLAGMNFLERRDPTSALERFEALLRREPDLAKAHFFALMAGFDLGLPAYARALQHGEAALKAERELSPEQRQLALRSVGVMQLQQNQARAAADTLSELVVRAPDLAEGQYNYACALARLGDAQGALDHLKVALHLDGDLAAHARDDEDLKSLRTTPAFQQLLTAPQ